MRGSTKDDKQGEAVRGKPGTAKRGHCRSVTRGAVGVATVVATGTGLFGATAYATTPAEAAQTGPIACSNAQLQDELTAASTYLNANKGAGTSTCLQAEADIEHHNKSLVGHQVYDIRMSHNGVVYVAHVYRNEANGGVWWVSTAESQAGAGGTSTTPPSASSPDTSPDTNSSPDATSPDTSPDQSSSSADKSPDSKDAPDAAKPDASPDQSSSSADKSPDSKDAPDAAKPDASPDQSAGADNSPDAGSTKDVTSPDAGAVSPAIAGANANATAAAVFNRVEAKTKSTTALLATNTNFPDALSASYLAARYKAGILLTNFGTLPASTKAALVSNNIKTVYVIGGPAAVSPAVTAAIRSLTDANATQGIQVIRLAGATQYSTNQKVVQSVQSAGGTPGSLDLTAAFAAASTYNDTTAASSPSGPGGAAPTAIVASGATPQAALAASVLAYADNVPIILTTPGSLSSTAQSELTALGIKQVILVGGPAAVSTAVQSQITAMSIPVLRIAGQDYTDTARLLAKFETSLGASNGGLTSPAGGTLNIVRGDFYTDAMVSAPLLGLEKEPLFLLLTSRNVGTYLQDYVQSTKPADVQAFGGSAAVTPGVVRKIENESK